MRRGTTWLENGKFVLPGYETLDPSRVGEIQHSAEEAVVAEADGDRTHRRQSLDLG